MNTSTIQTIIKKFENRPQDFVDEIEKEYIKKIPIDERDEVYYDLGHEFYKNGKYDFADILWHKGLDYYFKHTKKKDSEREAAYYINIGGIYGHIEDYTKAIKSFENALKIMTDINNYTGIAECYINLGNAHRGLNNYDKCKEYLYQAITVVEKLNDIEIKTICFNSLSAFFEELNDFPSAIDYQKKILKVFTEADDIAGKNRTLYKIAELNNKNLNYDEAIFYYEQSLELRIQLNDYSGQACCYFFLGDIYCKLNADSEAICFIKKARNIYRKLADKVSTKLCTKAINIIKYRNNPYRPINLIRGIKSRFVPKELNFINSGNNIYFLEWQDELSKILKNKLVKALIKSEPAIFLVGAGISIAPPSYCVGWGELKHEFTKVLLDKVNSVTKSYGFPPIDTINDINDIEEFFEIGIRTLGKEKIREFLSIFLNIGDPNLNHIMIAKYVKKGLIKTILTTNFDLYIEKAFDKLGIKYAVYSTEIQAKNLLSRMTNNPDNFTKIIKLHGSLDHNNSLLFSRYDLNKPLSDYKRKLLEYYLVNYNIFVFGYRGKDRNIYPILFNMKEKKRNVYWFSYAPNEARPIVDEILTKHLEEKKKQGI